MQRRSFEHDRGTASDRSQGEKVGRCGKALVEWRCVPVYFRHKRVLSNPHMIVLARLYLLNYPHSESKWRPNMKSVCLSHPILQPVFSYAVRRNNFEGKGIHEGQEDGLGTFSF